MTRKAAKSMAFWLSADATTQPVLGNAVAYIRALDPQLGRPTADVTAGADTWQQHVGGKPGGTLSISGVTDLTNGGSLQLMAAFTDGLPRLWRLLPDSADIGDYLTGTGFLESYNPTQGDVDGSWTFTATFRLTNTVSYVSAV